MLTKAEAYQRCKINRVRLQSRPYNEWRVTLVEWQPGDCETEARAYYTTDLEDAVLTGASMRRNQKD